MSKQPSWREVLQTALENNEQLKLDIHHRIHLPIFETALAIVMVLILIKEFDLL